jgi:hypothetical protein
LNEFIPVTVFPNPTADEVSLAFQLQNPSDIDIKIINLHGQTVIQNVSGKLSTGNYQLKIPLTGITEGAYLLRVTVDHQVIFKKLIKL